jgi:hypothetical protein
MKNVFRMLGALAIASSLMGCIIVDPISRIPATATQTSSSGIDSKTVKIFYKVTGSDGFNYSVNPSSVSAETLDSATVVSNDPNNPRAVVVISNTLTKCASVGGEGCFQIVTDKSPATSISGTISFKLDGSPLTLNYSATFLKPPVPASAIVVTTEGLDNLNFKIYFTAKTASNQVYSVNQAGLTDIVIPNVNQSSVSTVSTRAVVVTPVTAAVSCGALNAGQGCFQITIGSRPSGTQTASGSVSFKLDGTPLNLTFTHTFPSVQP